MNETEPPQEDWQPPDEIVKAANDIDAWMQTMGCEEWQIGPCASRKGYLRLERELAERKVAWLADQPDGEWIDKWGSCRVCGGEIPHGHMPKCDVYRYERMERAADLMLEALEIAKNTVECDSLDKDGNELPWYRAMKKAISAYRAEKDRETT